MKKVLLGAILFCVPLWSHAEEAMHAHFINVGQGDATLLEFPCGAILIDAGAQDAANVDVLVNYLEDFFKRRSDLKNTLNTILITHNHIDHTRALRSVIEKFTVQNYIDNGQLGGPGTGNPNWIRKQVDAGMLSVQCQYS